ncbi:MAG TPA: hypothetical protein VLY24_31785 [Bryobacteraceae bacterium]|nr:hypothetical protein [Bryobacteraceae bacterium]
MMEFLKSLEDLRFFAWVRESGSIWGYPSVLFLHTVGMAIVAGLNGAIDLRILGLAPQTPVQPLERLYPVMWWGFWLSALSGTILLVADASTKLTNPDFFVKMALIAVAMVIAAKLRTGVVRTSSGSSKGKLLAGISLICWVGVVTSGRLLAYVGPVSGASSLRHR